MKIAIVTNIRAPYRILQFNEFTKIENIKITAYYTHRESDNREWESIQNCGFKEVMLKGYRLSRKFGYMNRGLVELVKQNDVVIMGGYEQPTYIALSILCKVFNKSNIILFDGIGTHRLNGKENIGKKIIKNRVIKNANYIFGNGEVSRRYFCNIFNFPNDRIYNQYLTVDSNKIQDLYEDKIIHRNYYREKYKIKDTQKILIYSGRLIELKNVESVIKAIAKLERDDITLLILGGGDLRRSLESLAEKMNVNIIVTGFITNQEELFKHYYCGDCLILPSTNEVWGLVVNEAMFAGLPVLVSNRCGCSLDLVKNDENGYIIDPYDLDDIAMKMDKIFRDNQFEKMGRNSLRIIKEWTFINSRHSLKSILNNITSIKQ